MQLTKNISLQEIVPRSIYNEYGQKAVRFFSPGIIQGAQWIIDRHCIDKITINDWFFGGNRTQSGLRVEGQQYYREGFGAHDNGNALDMVSYNDNWLETLRKIHVDAIENPLLYQDNGIWRIEVLELANTWLHIDSIFTPNQKGVVFIDMKNRYTNLEYKQKLGL
jgi:hypothetical protein